MKKIIFIIVCLWGLGVSCSEDTKIGTPDEILPDYVLPQGDASDEANDRIQDIYDTYGAYVLYNYSSKDAFWTQTAVGGSAQIYVIKLGETRYVDEMLDYIHDIWLQFFPDEFLKKGGIPYRVFLADSIYWDRSAISPGWYTCYNQRINGNSVSIAGMNKDLSGMSASIKKARKNELISTMWDYYIAQGLLNVPDEFYKDTDYEKIPALPSGSEEALEAYRKRGFLPSAYYGETPSEWFWGDYAWTQAKENDLKSFMFHLRERTDAEVAWFLNNPEYELIQKKWNILIDYYKKEFGIDIRKMGNTTFE